MTGSLYVKSCHTEVLPVRTRAASNLRLTAAIATGSVKPERAAPHRTRVIGPASSTLESRLLPR